MLGSNLTLGTYWKKYLGSTPVNYANEGIIFKTQNYKNYVAIAFISYVILSFFVIFAIHARLQFMHVFVKKNYLSYI